MNPRNSMDFTEIFITPNFLPNFFYVFFLLKKTSIFQIITRNKCFYRKIKYDFFFEIFMLFSLKILKM